MTEILKNLSKKQKIIIVIISFIILSIILFWIYNKLMINSDKQDIILSNVESNDENIDIEIDEKQSEKDKILIDIKGEVNVPGVVSLKQGDRIIDAISAAGGNTENADLSRINLAYVVEDGSQIYIPKIGENTNEIEFVTKDAGDEKILTTNNGTNKNFKDTAKVNINTAGVEKLMTLTGIGEVMAQKIVNYREENGKFQKIEDLKNVSGIGESKFNNIKDKITIK